MSEAELPDDKDAAYFEKRARIGRAWTPSSPVADRDLFAGRMQQMDRVTDVVAQRGQHAVIYGERGVGKTSLAQVCQTVTRVVHQPSVVTYYTCNVASTLDDIVRSSLAQVMVDTGQAQQVGFTGEMLTTQAPLSGLLPAGAPAGIDEVRRALVSAAHLGPVILFVDEFDRIEGMATKTMLADLIKGLSDTGADVTIVLIGVADNVSELVGEHQSIDRALAQIEMPRMDDTELSQIIRRGAESCDLDVDEAFVTQVVELSQGFPHYVHLLAQHGAYMALDGESDTIEAEYFRPAIAGALQAVSASVRDRYYAAISTNRKGTIFREVMLACAMARKDALGRFGSADVREPLRGITGRELDIPAFAGHLNDFSSNGPRGGILRKSGTQRRFKYQFIDPLLPPYVIMQNIVTRD